MGKRQDKQLPGYRKTRNKHAPKYTVTFEYQLGYLERVLRGKAGKTGGDCSRDPRGTFQFSCLAEGLAKLRRVVILMLLVYYHKQRLQIKISTGIK